MRVHEPFAAKTRARYGSRGEAWLARLPEVLRRCEERFRVRLHEPLADLSYNLIVLGSLVVNGSPVVLKVSVDAVELGREARALAAFAGHGVARTLGFDSGLGAMLLERIAPGTSLALIRDDEEATRVFCRVFRELHEAPIAPSGFPSKQEHCAAIETTLRRGEGVVPWDWLARARDNLADLAASTACPVLLHGDLHHDNILLQGRDGEWVAIDPKGIMGDVHFDAVQYLLNYPERGGRADAVLERRLALIAGHLGLDPARIARWGVVKGVLNACWAVEDQTNDGHAGIQAARRFAHYLQGFHSSAGWIWPLRNF